MDCAGVDSFSGQLVGVEGLGVSSMVLVEICEAVVEEDRWVHVIRNGEIEGALGGVNDDAGCVGVLDLFSRPRWSIGFEVVA